LTGVELVPVARFRDDDEDDEGSPGNISLYACDHYEIMIRIIKIKKGDEILKRKK
jgi:hypothetical protein